MGGVIENSNPAVFATVSERKVLPDEEDDDIHDEIDAREVFDILLRRILPACRMQFTCWHSTVQGCAS